MNTVVECFPCFIRQTWEAVCLSTGNSAKRELVMRAVLRLVGEMDLRMPPPVMAQKVQRLIKTACGLDDPYRSVKKRFNRLAMELYPALQQRVKNAADPFAMAVRLAIAGNIIDVGSIPDLNDNHILDTIQKTTNGTIDQRAVEALRRAAAAAERVLYLADNAGEIVFDRLLIEQIGPEKTTMVVKAAPVLNDATREDAEFAGLTEIMEVIDNGSDAPGTVLEDAPAAFRRRFVDADLVIAKGQGNYETLGDARRPIFFLFQAKCPVIAAHVGCDVGAAVVHYSGQMVGEETAERV